VSTVIDGCVCRFHAGHCEEHLAVGAVLGDGEMVLQNLAILPIIIPPNLCQPCQCLPWGLTNQPTPMLVVDREKAEKEHVILRVWEGVTIQGQTLSVRPGMGSLWRYTRRR
jgi:hypothetical protein